MQAVWTPPAAASWSDTCKPLTASRGQAGRRRLSQKNPAIRNRCPDNLLRPLPIHAVASRQPIGRRQERFGGHVEHRIDQIPPAGVRLGVSAALRSRAVPSDDRASKRELGIALRHRRLKALQKPHRAATPLRVSGGSSGSRSAPCRVGLSSPSVAGQPRHRHVGQSQRGIGRRLSCGAGSVDRRHVLDRSDGRTAGGRGGGNGGRRLGLVQKGGIGIVVGTQRGDPRAAADAAAPADRARRWAK